MMLQVLWTVTILKFSYIMYRQPKIRVTNSKWVYLERSDRYKNNETNGKSLAYIVFNLCPFGYTILHRNTCIALFIDKWCAVGNADWDQVQINTFSNLYSDTFVYRNYCEHSQKTSGSNMTSDMTKNSFFKLQNIIISHVWGGQKKQK